MAALQKSELLGTVPKASENCVCGTCRAAASRIPLLLLARYHRFASGAIDHDCVSKFLKAPSPDAISRIAISGVQFLKQAKRM
jgi:hypothetical protein